MQTPDADLASFLARAGYTCATWTALPPGNRTAEAAAFLLQGRTLREGATQVAVIAEESYSLPEYNRVLHNGKVFATQVDAYCLKMALTRRYSNQKVVRAAGQAFSPTVPSTKEVVMAVGILGALYFFYSSSKQAEQESSRRLRESRDEFKRTKRTGYW